jgi:hypothetical protein
MGRAGQEAITAMCVANHARQTMRGKPCAANLASAGVAGPSWVRRRRHGGNVGSGSNVGNGGT